MTDLPHPDTASPPARRAVVALGANLGDRHTTLGQAAALIAAEIGPIVSRSRWLETPALIHPDDPAQSYPAYLNGVLVASTPLPPAEILQRLHAIEGRLGRDRGKETARWRPRLIDLDLIAVDDLVLDAEGLRLPHPEMHKRDFVLAPMCEVWPDWRHPILGRTAADLLIALDAPQR